MTTAERRGYQQICGDDGAMMVVAADQRGGMRKIMAASPSEEAAITDTMLGETKADLTTHLASYASCILLDPVCAVPRIVDQAVLGRNTALLIGLDASGFDVTPEGYRLSKLVPGIDARKVRALGGTGGKIMIYLRADRPKANIQNIEILDRCIADFAAEDLLLVVEFLTYELRGESQDDYKAAFPRLVDEGTRICLAAGSKVLKLPYPGDAATCTRITVLCKDVPWAVLSAGVAHETFLGQVEIAMANGASGVIAGRALLKDCISLNRNLTRERLTTIAVPRLRQIQQIVAKYRGEKAKAA